MSSGRKPIQSTPDIFVREVTSRNFLEVKGHVKRSLEKADFIAIDLEFTGLVNKPCIQHSLDTPEMRYCKVREAGVQHEVLQFGVSIFRWDVNITKHVVDIFNFHTFQTMANEQYPAYFSCDASSLAFLVRMGSCNFNKLIMEGIPSMLPEDFKNAEKNVLMKCRADVKRCQPPVETKNGVSLNLPNPDGLRLPDFLREAVLQINNLIKNTPKNKSSCIELKLHGSQRKQFYENVLSLYSDDIQARTTCSVLDKGINSDMGQNVIRIDKLSYEEKIELAKRKRDEELERLKSQYGFSEIVELIQKSSVPIVLHNGYLDLAHMYHHFLCPLPESYEAFLLMVQHDFPTIFDTKLLSTISVLSSDLNIYANSLDGLFQALGGLPLLRKYVYTSKENETGRLNSISKGFSNYPDMNDSFSLNTQEVKEEKMHMAGYDSFLTGGCFLLLMRKLGALTNEPRIFPINRWVNDVATLTGTCLNEVKNKLYLYKVYDYPYIDLKPCAMVNSYNPAFRNEPINSSIVNLAVQRKVPNRRHVFCLTFHQSWSRYDMYSLFRGYGRVKIDLIDETTASIIFEDAAAIETSNDALLTILHGERIKPNAGLQEMRNNADMLLKRITNTFVNTPPRKTGTCAKSETEWNLKRHQAVIYKLTKVTIPKTTQKLQRVEGALDLFVQRQVSGTLAAGSIAPTKETPVKATTTRTPVSAARKSVAKAQQAMAMSKAIQQQKRASSNSTLHTSSSSNLSNASSTRDSACSNSAYQPKTKLQASPNTRKSATVNHVRHTTSPVKAKQIKSTQKEIKIQNLKKINKTIDANTKPIATSVIHLGVNNTITSQVVNNIAVPRSPMSTSSSSRSKLSVSERKRTRSLSSVDSSKEEKESQTSKDQSASPAAKKVKLQGGNAAKKAKPGMNDLGKPTRRSSEGEPLAEKKPVANAQGNVKRKKVVVKAKKPIATVGDAENPLDKGVLSEAKSDEPTENMDMPVTRRRLSTSGV